MFRCAAALASIAMIGSCGRGREDAPAPAGSSSVAAPAPPGTLHAIAELRAPAILVVGTRRIALQIAGESGADGWYEPAANGLVARPAIGDALASARGTHGALVETFLGAAPIASGGEEHRERTLRFMPQPQAIDLHGALAQVATTGALEIWRYEHELRSELAVISASGALAPLPALPLVGPSVAADSPVSAKACAAPKVIDLASTGDAILALIVECHRSAPVRIATYRAVAGGALGPPAIATLASLDSLELRTVRLLATRAGEPILVGLRGDAVAVVRFAAGAPSPALGPHGVDTLTHAALADDGAVWTRAIGHPRGSRDVIVIARNGTSVPLATPAGAAVRPESLAVDSHLGAVVLATSGEVQWLFAERPSSRTVSVLSDR